MSERCAHRLPDKSISVSRCMIVVHVDIALGAGGLYEKAWQFLPVEDTSHILKKAKIDLPI